MLDLYGLQIQLKSIYNNIKEKAHMGKSYRYTKLERRGHEITLPTETYNALMTDGYNISLVMNGETPRTVQLSKGNKYAGTLKTELGVSGFRDGNVCNFTRSNTIRGK